VLGLGGIVSVVVGSLRLPGDVPGVALRPGVVVPVALAMSTILVFLGRLAVRAQQQPPATGADAMIGLYGRPLAAMTPDRPAQVAVHGEIWNAIATAAVAAGEPVTVVGVDGLTLRVAPARHAAEGASS
jgi:membrane-bound serine protease (ClpP class)